MKSVTTVLALTICSLFMSASAFAQVPPTTITFDGFCDGMALTFSGGEVGGTLSGCEEGLGFAGGKVFATDLSGALEMGISSSANAGCLLNYYFNVPAKTWSNYQTCDGSVPSYINSGTFSYSATNKSRGPASFVKQ